MVPLIMNTTNQYIPGEASRVISQSLELLKPQLERYPNLWKMFRQCFLNTIDTTVQQTEGDTFVITGDIPAMWLRDSTAQVLHYLRFAEHPEVARMLEGLIARQAACILRDPYGNAFNRIPSAYKPFDDIPEASEWVWERKYEVDSLCYPLWLADKYYQKTGSTAFLTPEFLKAVRQVVEVFRTEQNHEADSPYRFQRVGGPAIDTLVRDGLGGPVGYTGMTWSGFRPSDDVCTYGYLIPSNLFAARAMDAAARLADRIGYRALAEEAARLGKQMEAGVREFGIVDHPKWGQIYAYETDGLGSYNLMDDANVPSLLSLPYLDVCSPEDPLYRNTRAFVLSRDNPFFYTGACAAGIGSPHTAVGNIWPISLCIQAMTSQDPREIAGLLHTLMHTHAETFFMHESFDANNPEDFTRVWFAWANSLFGEFIYRLYEQGILDQVLTLALEMDG